MKKTYIDNEKYTKEEVKKAYQDGKIVLLISRVDSWFSKEPRICKTQEEAEKLLKMDTRGECYSISEEVWTTRPKSLKEVLEIASCYPRKYLF